MLCPLCSHNQSLTYDKDKFRSYHLCHACSLIYVPREKILSFEAEANRYEAHQNDEGEEYRAYLSSIVDGIRPIIPKNASGLDFGCGKTTLMSKIFASFGIHVDSYDLYFHPHQDIWQQKYDFIVLSEVIEHLSDPKGVMLKLVSLLQPKGHIIIKTKLYPPDPTAFRTWFYKRDQTHVQFFDYRSLTVLAGLMGMKGPQKLSGPDLFAFSAEH